MLTHSHDVLSHSVIISFCSKAEKKSLGLELTWHCSQMVTRSNWAASLNGLFVAFIYYYIGEGLFPSCLNLVPNLHGTLHQHIVIKRHVSKGTKMECSNGAEAR